jgi:tetratricopeptide (TPR) repeat protein
MEKLNNKIANARYEDVSPEVKEWRRRAFDLFNEKRFSEAAEYFEKAANSTNDKIDEYNTGLSYAQYGNYQNASIWFDKSANQGYANARTQLPKALFNMGLKSFDVKDYNSALKYFQRAYEKGSGDAATNIGYMYVHGYGVAQDYNTALAWYEKAMKMGTPSGKINYQSLKSYLQNPQQPTQQVSSTQKRGFWGTFAKVLSVTSDAVLSAAQTYYQTQAESSSSSSNGASSSSSASKSSCSSSGGRCAACGGDGKCHNYHNAAMYKQSCNGTGKCTNCNGSGVSYTAGSSHQCGFCNGSGDCPHCNGSGRCKKCGGSGH